MIVSSIAIYMLALGIALTFELIKVIVTFGFRNQFFRRRALVVKITHYSIIVVSIVLTVLSLKLSFFIGAAIVLLLLIIDLTLRTN